MPRSLRSRSVNTGGRDHRRAHQNSPWIEWELERPPHSLPCTGKYVDRRHRSCLFQAPRALIKWRLLSAQQCKLHIDGLLKFRKDRAVVCAQTPRRLHSHVMQDGVNERQHRWRMQ